MAQPTKENQFRNDFLLKFKKAIGSQNVLSKLALSPLVVDIDDPQRQIISSSVHNMISTLIDRGIFKNDFQSLKNFAVICDEEQLENLGSLLRNEAFLQPLSPHLIGKYSSRVDQTLSTYRNLIIQVSSAPSVDLQEFLKDLEISQDHYDEVLLGEGIPTSVKHEVPRKAEPSNSEPKRQALSSVPKRSSWELLLSLATVSQTEFIKRLESLRKVPQISGSDNLQRRLIEFCQKKDLKCSCDDPGLYHVLTNNLIDAENDKSLSFLLFDFSKLGLQQRLQGHYHSYDVDDVLVIQKENDQVFKNLYAVNSWMSIPRALEYKVPEELRPKVFWQEKSESESDDNVLLPTAEYILGASKLTSSQKDFVKVSLSESLFTALARAKSPTYLHFQTLSVNNFGPIGGLCTYRLNGIGLSLVTAELLDRRSNGFGKTTLSITSLIWCLTGLFDDKAAGKPNSKDLLHKNQENGFVHVSGNLECGSSSKSFSITRTLSFGKGISLKFDFDGTTQFMDFEDETEPIVDEESNSEQDDTDSVFKHDSFSAIEEKKHQNAPRKKSENITSNIGITLFGLQQGLTSVQFRDHLLCTIFWNRFTDVGFLRRGPRLLKNFINGLFPILPFTTCKSKFEKEVKKLSDDIADETKELEKNKTKVKELTEKCTSITKTISTHSSQLGNLEEQLNTQKNEIKSKQASISQLENEIDVTIPPFELVAVPLEEDLEISNNHTREIEVEIKKLSKMKDKWLTERVSLESERKSLKLRQPGSFLCCPAHPRTPLFCKGCDCNTKEKASRDYDKLVAEHDASKKKIDEKISTAEENESEAAENIEKLTMNLANYRKTEKIKIIKKKQEEQKKQLEKEHTARKAKNKDLVAKKKQEQDELNKLNVQVGQLEAEINEKNKKIKEFKTQIADASSEITQINLKLPLHETKLTKLQSEKDNNHAASKFFDEVPGHIAEFIRVRFQRKINFFLASLFSRPMAKNGDATLTQNYVKVVLSIHSTVRGPTIEKSLQWFDGRDTRMSSLSTGEYLRTHLSFFLAYGELVAEARNYFCNICMFDECFSGMDAAGILTVTQTLSQLCKERVVSVNPKTNVTENNSNSNENGTQPLSEDSELQSIGSSSSSFRAPLGSVSLSSGSGTVSVASETSNSEDPIPDFRSSVFIASVSPLPNILFNWKQIILCTKDQGVIVR